ncbi:hypothetical protein BT63DRAFT_87185 [Microthyrium microscopicum]|uniref:Uncharacterized protein n=1 Tax=Microthyrium microscopicum TaxID=703497 RepID=A0A6A6U0R6_9PEZI|nr:hypothetical protein BT63DRAFT_87185 [Microthyrium microscopicum]
MDSQCSTVSIRVTIQETDDVSLAETLASIRAESIIEWTSYDARLKSFKERMENILPILQADLNSYHTSRIAFVNQDNEECKKADKMLPVLRNRLYNLKDTLNNLHKIFLSKGTNGQMVVERFEVLAFSEVDIGDITKALSVYLSNHGSDWLNSLLSGGLSFSEFRSLDISYVNEVEQDMVEWGNEICREVASKDTPRLDISKKSFIPLVTNRKQNANNMSEFAEMLPYRLERLAELKQLLKVD